MPPPLPTGTVTFLFTDIEGSTRLLQELGEAYTGVLAEHHRALRGAFAAHGGFELGTEGDAFFVAFESARGAAAAALDAQAALAGGPVRVRMGLHTGTPRLTPDGYVGLDLHRAARICSAGHGGQVLVSAPAREMLGDAFALEDLGLHRLKDLAEPERLFQLGAGAFPPLRSLNATNLPLPASPLVGRRREVDEVAALLRADVRLVTVLGPGGTGKTRLALAVAADLADEFPDGVRFVALAPIADPELVVPAVAETLGVREQASEPIAASVAHHLESRRLLVVLDNFEHLSAAATDVGDALLRAPRVRVLATSREPLRVYGEHEYLLPPLAREEALALFAERARAVRSGFALDGDEALADAICERVDRLPLAIELAAVRVKVLPLAEILRRLDDRLSLLANARPDVPERQRTLRATVEWSYDLLEPAEAGLFERLAVFAGGWTLEDAEAVAGADLDTLSSLVDKSLVRLDAEARFSMLETIRELAVERLEQSPGADGLQSRHAERFAALAARAEPELRGEEQGEWLRLLGAEHGNLRAALAWSVERRPPLALELAGALGRFWYVRALAREGSGWLRRALDANPGAPPALRAKVLHQLGILTDERGDLDEAARLFASAAGLRRAAGDRRGLAASLNSQAIVARNQGDFPRARALFEEALDLKRELGDGRDLATTLCGLGLLSVDEGRFDEARELLEQSLELDRESGDLNGIAVDLGNLAAVALEQQDAARAAPLVAEALAAFAELGDPDGVAECVELAAGAAAAAGAHERAALLAGAAAAIREPLGMPPAPVEAARLARFLQPARDALGPGYEPAFAAGRALDQEAAIREVLGAR